MLVRIVVRDPLALAIGSYWLLAVSVELSVRQKKEGYLKYESKYCSSWKLYQKPRAKANPS